jgi:bacteriocin biosynthesis cyclodehydratase domain-containing protein
MQEVDVATDETPRIKRFYSLVPHSLDRVELRYGVWNAVSHTVADESAAGKLYPILRHLDGSLTPKEISRKLGVPVREIEALLDHLEGLGVLEAASSNALDYHLDTVASWRGEPEAARPTAVVLLGDEELCAAIRGFIHGSLGGTPVESPPGDDAAALQLADPDRAWLFDALALESRLPQFEHWRGSFVVHAEKVVSPLVSQALNRVCAELRVPWMHVALDGPFLLVGPIFLPHRTACFECLELRVTMNLRESGSYQRYKQALAEGEVRRGPLAIEPALIGMLASHAALEALNYALTGYSFTVGKILTVYLPTMEFSFSEVLRAPTCPSCGSLPEREATELYFGMEALAT